VEDAPSGGTISEPRDDDRIPYDNGGCLPSGLALYRNNTGRALHPDEWHLATRVEDDPL
jgi:hypothetical protein